jgi:YVTN family beta-propeller protein
MNVQHESGRRTTAAVWTGLLLAAIALATVPCPAGAAIAAAELAYRVFVTDEFGGTLAVIDASTDEVRSLALGKRPRGLKLSADRRSLYVALSGSPIAGPGVDEKSLPPADKSADGIGVVDLETLTLRTVMRGVSDPEQLAVSADGKRLYVASEDTGALLVFDARRGNKLGESAVGGEPEGVAVSPDGRVVYVTSEADGVVAAIDGLTYKVLATVRVGQRPRGLAFSPDGSQVYVTCENDGNLVIVDARKHEKTGEVHFPGRNARPMGVAVSRDGATIYVTTGRGKTVESVDAATLTIKGSVEVGDRPWGIALSPDGQRLYTANGPSDDVSVIDAHSLELIRKIKAPGRPWGVIIGPSR